MNIHFGKRANLDSRPLLSGDALTLMLKLSLFIQAKNRHLIQQLTKNSTS
jgi:hypothetical protein